MGAGRIVLLLGSIAVKCVIGFGIDRLEQTVSAVFLCLRGIIGYRHQPLAFNLSLGKESHAAILIIVFLNTGVLQIFHFA